MALFKRKAAAESARDASTAPGLDLPGSGAEALIELTRQRLEELSTTARRASEDVAAARDRLRASEAGQRSDSQAATGLADALAGRTAGLADEAAQLTNLLRRSAAALSRSSGADRTAPTVTSEEQFEGNDAAQSSYFEEEQEIGEGPIEVSDIDGAEADEAESLEERVSERFMAADGGESNGGPFRSRRQHEEIGATQAPAALAETSGSVGSLRLLATQMAVAGSSRSEIEDRLKQEFGVEDTNLLLSDVFEPTAGGRHDSG